MARPPKHEDDRITENRVYIPASNNRLRNLEVLNRAEYKRLLLNLLDTYESELEQKRRSEKG